MIKFVKAAKNRFRQAYIKININHMAGVKYLRENINRVAGMKYIKS